MTKYVALLRGINVGGKKLIKMDYLISIFASLGYKNVKTFIQCGNVIFDASETAPDLLKKKIEKKLLQSLGYEVTVILRTVAGLEKFLKRNPFKTVEPDANVMLCVAFLSAEPAEKPKLPLLSATDNLEVVAIKERAAFILARRKKTGWFGFPNNFIEKQFGVTATTRQLTTVLKLIAFANSEE